MLPLDEKFNLNSFTIAHADGSTEAFDGSLADAYANLDKGDTVAYSCLGDKYTRPPYMNWVPVLIDAENMHEIRPIIRKLTKEHTLAVGRFSSKQAVLVFPLNRNFPVAGSDTIDYQTVYQSLLNYFTGVVKNTATEADVDIKVNRMPYLLTPSSETVHLVHDARLFAENNVKIREEITQDKRKNGGKGVANLEKGLEDLPTDPNLKQFKAMDQFLDSGDDERTLYVSKALHYSKLTGSFIIGAGEPTAHQRKVNTETEKQLFSLIKAVYLHYHKDTNDAEKTLSKMSREVERLNPYSGKWDTAFEDITQDPSKVYGLKADWNLKFYDGKPWVVPTESLMKMFRGDISDIKTPKISMIMTGSKENRHPKAGMTSNYELEIVDPKICGHSLAYNKISKQVELLHAIDTRYVHGAYESRDKEGAMTDVDRNRAFNLTDALVAQIKVGLEQVEGNVISKSGLLEAIKSVAQQNSYDPVSSYLDSLPEWDGEERLKTMFINFLGVPDVPIMRKESEIFGIAAVYMALNPGSKFDQMFDLVGTQGVGKTTFLEKYFNSFSKKGVDPTWPRDNFDWYLSGIHGFDGKDDILSMAGMICVNDDEMTASRGTDAALLKRIASDQKWKVRVPYGLLPDWIERTFIICRTSNLTQNLYTASHGQRKFVPFLVSKARHTMDCAGPNSSMTPWLVDQFWAEAYAKYIKLKADGNLTKFFSLSRAEEDQLQEMRVSLQYIDDIKINTIGFVNARLKQQRGQWPMQFETREIIKYITGEERDNSSLAKKLQPILTNDLSFKHTLVKVGRSHRSGYVSTDETIKDLKQLNDDLAKA